MIPRTMIGLLCATGLFAQTITTLVGTGKPGFDEKNGVFYMSGGYAPAGRALAITVLTYDNASGRILDADGMRLHRPVDPDEHHDLLVWQHESGPEDISRVVTDWRSTARPSVAGHPSSGGRGRRCHAGPRRATDPGRLPGPYRTTKAIRGLASTRVDQ